MFQQIRILAILGGLSVLAACTSGQSFSPTGSTMTPSVQKVSSPASIAPDKGCGGAYGVKVGPCPIKLSDDSGIVVTVKGPKVVNSELGDIQSCYSGHICYYAQRVDGSQTQWLITPGQRCGGAILEFKGENARGKEVGYTFLEIHNRYCPKR